MGEDTRVDCFIGDGGHPDRIRRPARLQVDPPGEDGDGRVPLEIGWIEATQAALDRREVPAVVERRPEVATIVAASSSAPAASACSIARSRLPELRYHAAAVRCSTVDRPGSRRSELGEQKLAEQVVVAVGEGTSADLLDEQVAPHETLQASACVGHPGDDFGNAGRHHLNDRGPGKEPQVVLPEALGQLGREVRRDVAVTARDRDRHAALTPGAPAGDRCQIGPHRPALGSPVQLQHAIGVEMTPGRPRKRGRLPDVERKRRWADLEELPACAIAPERHRRLAAAGQRDAQVEWKVVEQGREGVETRPGLEAVRVVEDGAALVRAQRYTSAYEARHR